MGKFFSSIKERERERERETNSSYYTVACTYQQYGRFGAGLSSAWGKVFYFFWGNE